MPEKDKAAVPQATSAYEQPKVYVGETVLWSAYGGQEKLVGIVTSKSSSTVNLTVLADGQIGQRTMRGVRHRSDPALKTMVDVPGGVWEHTEFGKLAHALID